MPSGPHLVSLIPIKKMDRAIGFYTKKLGAKVVYRGEGPMKDFWASLSVGGCDVWFVAPDKREVRKLAYHTFLVPDIKKFVAKLQKAGVKFDKAQRMNKDTKIDGPIATDTFGASAFFQDTEGNTMMVWQNFPPM
jgi:catechol 2,3-dioxygenase-like lactoylglutathione lyase family enzyme